MALLVDSCVYNLRTIQPYFTFSSGGTYEIKVVEYSPISHFYTFEAEKSEGQVIAVPDASIDILFMCDERQAAVRLCGTPSTARLVEIQSGKRYFGVRFHLGKIPQFIKYDSRMLVDGEFPLQDIIEDGDILLERVVKAENFEERIECFYQHFCRILTPKASPVAWQMHQLITINRGTLSIKDISKHTGYSTRYVNKLFTDNFGLSPKAYSLILRFQHVLQQMLLVEQKNLTDLASDKGYSDQSHFFREFKKFAALAPSKFMQKATTNNYGANFIKSRS